MTTTSSLDNEGGGNGSGIRELSTFQQSIGAGHKYVQNMQTRLPGLIMNKVIIM